MEKKSASDWPSMSLSSDWPWESSGVDEPLKKSPLKVSARVSKRRLPSQSRHVQPKGGGSLSLMADGGCERTSSLAACSCRRGKWSLAGAGARGLGVVGAAARAMTCSRQEGDVHVHVHVQVEGRLQAGCGGQRSRTRTAVPGVQSQRPADIAGALAQHSTGSRRANPGEGEGVSCSRRHPPSSHVHMPEVCASRGFRGLLGCACPDLRDTPDLPTTIISTLTLACHLLPSRGALTTASSCRLLVCEGAWSRVWSRVKIALRTVRALLH